MVVEDFVQRVGMELHARLQVEEFAEGEAAEVVALHDVAQLEVFFLQPHDRRAGEDYFQIGEAVVAHAQLLAPVGELEHLVDEQHFAAAALEFVGKLDDAVPREVEVVHVDEEAGAVGAEFFLGILEQEGCLAHATGALDADEPSLQSISSMRSRRTGALVCSTR